MSGLTAEEYGPIERADGDGRPRRAGTLNIHAVGWTCVIEIVEEGYSLIVHDYINDPAVAVEKEQAS